MIAFVAYLTGARRRARYAAKVEQEQAQMRRQSAAYRRMLTHRLAPVVTRSGLGGDGTPAASALAAGVAGQQGTQR